MRDFLKKVVERYDKIFYGSESNRLKIENAQLLDQNKHLEQKLKETNDKLRQKGIEATNLKRGLERTHSDLKKLRKRGNKNNKRRLK
jgi:translation initiation factor IF-2